MYGSIQQKMESSTPIRKFLSHFERTRILSLRATALANGASTTLHNNQLLPTSAIEIAKLEMEQGLIPYTISRTLPDGRGRQRIDANRPERLLPSN